MNHYIMIPYCILGVICGFYLLSKAPNKDVQIDPFSFALFSLGAPVIILIYFILRLVCGKQTD
jgi:hypothetical protein